MLTGEEKELTLEEKLRRERARQMNTGMEPEMTQKSIEKGAGRNRRVNHIMSYHIVM